MASEMQTTENKIMKFWPRKNRILQKRLRSCGQEYISRSGKVIPAKTQPDELCQCPQRCDEKVPTEIRAKLFEEFYKIGDHSRQNDFLMAHIKTRAVQRRSTELKIPGRNQRRVSCKYQVPLPVTLSPPLQPGQSPPGLKLVEVCQKAFMNVFAITEKRVRLQREKLIARVLQTKIPKVATAPAISAPTSTLVTFPMPMSELPVTMGTVQRRQVKVGQIGEVGLWRDEPVFESAKPKSDVDIMKPLLSLTPNQIEIWKERHHEIDLVDNFFSNQLWKPEYINTAT
ncbi:hypothetical protein R5R35_003049 [Gryllus longicercus]|uniref:Uncharacterized protein n=2 Tax=Gryllus longicercus TaxID=2509291 RepID=A0AAN9VSU4_9ORTH